MRISPNVTSLPALDPIPRLVELAQAADESGVHTLWMPDHLQQVAPGRAIDEPVLEAYGALAWLAAQTSRVRLGAMVSPAPLRLASLLVKQVTDLDALSGGRAWFGVGAGYRSAENDHLDLPSPPTAERFAALEAVLVLAHRVWSTEPGGAAPALRPRPVSRPHPPILVGGAGERRTLPLAARFADAANLFDVGDDEILRRKIGVLRGAQHDAGRDEHAVELTISTRWSGTEVDPFLAHLDHLASLGFEHAVVLRDRDWTVRDLHTLLRAASTERATT